MRHREGSLARASTRREGTLREKRGLPGTRKSLLGKVLAVSPRISVGPMSFAHASLRPSRLASCEPQPSGHALPAHTPSLPSPEPILLCASPEMQQEMSARDLSKQGASAAYRRQLVPCTPTEHGAWGGCFITASLQPVAISPQASLVNGCTYMYPESRLAGGSPSVLPAWTGRVISPRPYGVHPPTLLLARRRSLRHTYQPRHRHSPTRPGFTLSAVPAFGARATAVRGRPVVVRVDSGGWCLGYPILYQAASLVSASTATRLHAGEPLVSPRPPQPPSPVC